MIPREARAPRPCRTRIRVHGAKEKIVPKQKAHKKCKVAQYIYMYVST